MELSLRYTTLNVFLCPFEKLIVVTNALLTLILLGKTLLVSLLLQVDKQNVLTLSLSTSLLTAQRGQQHLATLY